MPVSGGTHPEILERGLSPAQERVPFLIPDEFELGVQLEGVALGEVVDLNRMVDDQLDRLQRVDFLGIAAEPDHAVAHRGEIDHCGHSSEIL